MLNISIYFTAFRQSFNMSENKIVRKSYLWCPACFYRYKKLNAAQIHSHYERFGTSWREFISKNASGTLASAYFIILSLTHSLTMKCDVFYFLFLTRLSTFICYKISYDLFLYASSAVPR